MSNSKSPEGYVYKQGFPDEIIELAWAQYEKHAEECPECAELMRLAAESEDMGRAFWLIGFSTAMDMMEAGHLRPAPHEQN